MDNLEQALLESENSLMLLSDEELITPINDILIINPETRLIEVPSTELLLGVFGENLVEKKYFKCPRIVLNNIDLYECFIFINYVSANGRIGSIQSENVELDETEQYILFDWDLTNNVFDKNKDSTIYFSVSAKQYLEDSEPVFATRKAQGKMYETINETEYITQEHADIILQILAGMKTKVDLPKDEDGNLLVPEEGQTLLFKEDGTTYYGTPSGGGGTSFSGSAKDVTYDDTETKLGTENVQDAIGKLSEEIVDYNIEPKTGDIPKVFIDGVIPTTKDEVLAVLTYVSKTETFKAYIKIKCQGTSSMNYPKKNFTVKLYSDEARETKIKKLFKDWKIASDKFVLKANFIDHSHARNIICARLWNEVVASRSDYDSLPEELRTSPRNGAIDGFPVKVYTNGTYQGIYTWNIGKDAWMWNMDEDNPNHVLLCAETNTNDTYAETPCNFRALWNGVHENHWSVEVGTNSTMVKDSLNALISCVKDTDDETFKATIENYLDIQSAIDYYIHQYVICGIDGLAKNMLIGAFDLVKWYCGAYDMDSVLGLYWDGKSFVPSNHACPEDYQEKHSLLFERIEKLFFNELRARYIELRKTVYSFGNMCTHFERFMDVIGSELYAEDLTIYNGIPSGNTNNIKQIRDYIRDRLAYCDEEFGAMTEPISATGITLDKTSLSFTEATNQVLVATVEPSDSTDKVVWSSSNDGIAKVVNGVVTPITNGSCTITATAGSVSATCDVEVNMETTPYLQNDGVAYIDLGINSADGYSYEICLKDEKLLSEEAGERIYFGNRFNMLKNSGQNYIAWTLKGSYNGLTSMGDDKKHVYKVDANNLYLDGVIDGTANWGTSTNHPSMVLFGANFINGGNGFYLASLTRVIKFYYLKIWNSNNELIHSYVPALKDGVACVLDEVTNEYLYNSAESGGFTYGED